MISLQSDFGGLELKMLDRIKEHLGMSGEDKLKDPQKRESMKKIGKTVLGVAGLSAAPSLAFASSNFPPGIENCRDKALKEIYFQIQNQRYDNSRFLLEGKGLFGMHIQPESFFIEPAYFFLLEKHNAFAKKGMKLNLLTDLPFKFKELEQKNPALDYFSLGMGDYFAKWVRKEKYDSKIVEDHLLKAIFASAYQTHQIGLQKFSEYSQTPDMRTKTQMLNELTTTLEKSYQIDKNSKDPQNGYNRRLVAAWASFFLTDHSYRIEKESTKTLLYYEDLEQKTKKLLGHPIRGPPHYNL